MNCFYSKYFIMFLLFVFFSSFLNNKRYNTRHYLVSYALSGEFMCGLGGMTYTRKSLNVRNRKPRKIPSFLLLHFRLIILKLVATLYSQILTQILPILRFK